jgi:phospholipid/cholesterol/gamma-HCH transport system ATP-binding protein
VSEAPTDKPSEPPSEKPPEAPKDKPAEPPADKDPIAIRVRGLSKSFGTHEVLRGVDLDIERGRINIIIGGSGQGKSVLLKHVMGLLKPDAGSIVVDGVDITTLSEPEFNTFRRRFGMVFQYAALFDSFTVEENVAFPLVEHTKMKAAERHDAVARVLASLHLPEVIWRKYPSEISGGQRKRVGLARALVLQPEILLYDEPTTGLDPIATKNVDDMIRDISQETGVTSVVISHDMASTFRIGHRISMLYDGKMIASGCPADILRSEIPELRAFVETSGAVAMSPLGQAAKAPEPDTGPAA